MPVISKIKSSIVSNVVKLLPSFVKSRIIDDYKQKIKYRMVSYAQEGEDLLLENILNFSKNGFFVDVGAHHPVRFSNTYKLYLQGWRGINIDPAPGSMKKFETMRPEDINLEMAIAASEKPMTYFVFNDSALNTFDEEKKNKIIQNSSYKNISQIKVNTTTLEKVLNKYLPADVKIDFMNIDVENMELEVLKSNDWSKYRPNILLIENIKEDLREVLNSE
ncbi:MAG: FkbM family methyltransferase, partial [Bacteroidia bacterium]|nr:FkbM family methyltransferase [Bacteroidia bacterium]